jgi:hypothetical protein
LLDGVAIDGVQCGRGGIAGTQVKTGVMPWAAHGCTFNEPFSQWSTVMRAGSADCEELRPLPNEDDELALNLAEQWLRFV